MGLLKQNQFTETKILANKLLDNFGNEFIFVSARPYPGKVADGETILPAGANITLQVIKDLNPYKNPTTGEIFDNSMEQFTVTVVGIDYPLPFKKGQHVRLGKFISEHSYFIDFNLILRFGEIIAVNNNASNNLEKKEH